MTGSEWVKSSYSSPSGNCVEVAAVNDASEPGDYAGTAAKSAWPRPEDAGTDDTAETTPMTELEDIHGFRVVRIFGGFAAYTGELLTAMDLESLLLKLEAREGPAE
jgi:Domain of unknown function (DUF397)